MKEQTQQPGVRKWAGDDMIALQAEPLSAIQGFFKEYGNCIIQGCETNAAAGGKFNIAPGLLGLSGMDADGVATFKVVPFSGVENVTLPLYFTLTHSVVDRVYGDGKVKPIMYDYRAAVSAVRPAAGVEFLELTTAGGRRFVDAVKITEKLDKVGNGKDVTVTFAQATTRENIASGEKLTTVLGKIVRWLADLKALAFKDKVSKADMDTALQGELNGKEPGFTKNTAFNKNFGAAAGTVCQGNDARLSDARTASGGNADSSFFNKINIVDNDDLSVPTGNQQLQAFISKGLGAAREGGDGYILAQKYHSQCCAQLYIDADPTYNIALRQSDAVGKWNAWKKLAFLSDIPASLPANGGNADTVGGKRVSDFVQTNGKNILNGSLTIKDSGVKPIVIYSYGQPNPASILIGNDNDFIFRLHNTPTGDDMGTDVRFNSEKFTWAGKQVATLDSGNLTLNTSNASYVTLNRNNVSIGYMGLGSTTKKDLLFQLYQSGNFIRIGEDGKNYSNTKEIATVDQIPTNFSQIEDAVQKIVAVGTILRKTIVTATKTGNGYVSRVALGLTNPLSRFSPAILSVGANDLGTEWVDYAFGIDGHISSPAGTFALTSEIKTLSGGAAPTAGQYISGITVNDHAITVTKEALPTSDLGGIGANSANWDTFTTPGSNWTNPMGWGTNAPNTPNMNGLLIVSRSGNCIVQCYEPSDATGAFKRVKPIDGYWSDWKQCAMKSDFNTANIAESANKRFMSDAQEAKLDGSLEVAFAGIVDADGGKVKSKGRMFNVQKNDYGLFTVTHGENDAFLIVQVMSEGGQVGVAHTFTSRTFKVDSYAGAGGNSNGRGFRFVAYKL